MFEVIESKALRNVKTGRVVSLYGAHPDANNPADWEIFSRGWTVRNVKTGVVGVGRKPWETRDEAEAFAAAKAA